MDNIGKHVNLNDVKLGDCISFVRPIGKGKNNSYARDILAKVTKIKDGMIFYKIWNKDTSSWAESPYKGYLSSNSNTNGDANTIVVWDFCPDDPKWEEASKRALQTRRKKNRKSRKRRNP